MRRLVVVALLVGLVAGAGWAQDWNSVIGPLLGTEGKKTWKDSAPWDPQKAQQASRVLQQFPMKIQASASPILQQQYGVAYAFLVFQIGRQGNYQQAVGLANQYLEVFPTPTCSSGAAVGVLRLRYLLQAGPSPEQKLAALRTTARQLVEGELVLPWSWAAGRNGWESTRWYVDLISTELSRAGYPEEAVQFLQDLASHHARLLTADWYWDAAVGNYLELDRPQLAHQAALCAYRVCEFERKAINQQLQRLYKTLVATGEIGKAEAFIDYVITAEGQNPLQEIGFPQISDQQLEQLVASGRDERDQVAAYLYAGRYQQAIQTAQKEVFGDREDCATASAYDIARCFKARDLHLGRANQFIAYLRTGSGENPLEEF